MPTNALIVIFNSSFEAISKFAPEEKQVIKAVLEGMILKHDANAGPLPLNI